MPKKQKPSQVKFLWCNMRFVEFSAISRLHELRKLAFGDRVRTIDIDCVECAPHLEEVVIPPTVEEIHDCAFANARLYKKFRIVTTYGSVAHRHADNHLIFTEIISATELEKRSKTKKCEGDTKAAEAYYQRLRFCPSVRVG